MKFGTYFFIQATPDRPASAIVTEELDQMVLSERLGFDSVWLTEHHYSDYGLSSAPSVLLAALAARTTRIRLGMAVYVLPFHHPLKLAEETATLDILSGGRFTVGLGRGNRPLEFVGHGVVQDESRGRLQEGLDVLRLAWGDDPVRYHGSYWRFDGVPVYPKPLSRPHPPLAFAASSTESIDWAGANGLAIMSSGLFTPLPAMLNGRNAYEQALRAAGHADALVESLLQQWIATKHVYVAPTDAEARADAEGPERWYLNSFARSMRPDGLTGISAAVREAATVSADRVTELRWENLVEESLLIGSPSTVRRKVAELREAGVGELLCWMNFGGIPPAKARRSMALFAREVMPDFQA